MRLKLTSFFLLFAVTLTFSQIQGYDKTRPALLLLNNGDTLKGVGKLKSKYFKHQKYFNGKSIKIPFNKIKKIEFKFNFRSAKSYIRTFYILPLKDGNKLIPVEKLVMGNKINLFSVTVNYNSHGNHGISEIYYIQEKTENKITKLGAYSPPFGDLKDKLKALFNDCNSLLKKIENKEYRVRYGSDILKMFEFYNEECK